MSRAIFAGRALLLSSLLASGALTAHPEDEFCVPGEDGLDPALCEALSTLDDATATPDDVRPILDPQGRPRGFWSTAGLYLTIGIGHILPGGVDHILFVLALCLSSTRVKPLVLQISTFTVAHTTTLALVAAGAVAPDPAVVEPLIAATIAFVAIENAYFRDMPRWRPLAVFLFGLVHGMGFAGFFGSLGLPESQFWSALVGFNVGVEFGQIGVVLAALILAALLRRYISPLRSRATYRRCVTVPVSLLIGLTGMAWTVERLL